MEKGEINMFKMREETKENLKNAGKIIGIAALFVTGAALMFWGIKSGNTPEIESSENNYINDELAERRVA